MRIEGFDISFERPCSNPYCVNGKIDKRRYERHCGCCHFEPEGAPTCPDCKGTGVEPSELGEDLLEFVEKYFHLKRKE